MKRRIAAAATIAALGMLGAPAAAAVADETSTVVSCSPNPVVLGGAASCTAVVSSLSPPGFPAGDVSFTSAGPGGALSSSQCTLSALTGAAQCKVSYTPSALGLHGITAAYLGDGEHDPSEGATTVQSVAPPPPPVAKPVKCRKGFKKVKRKGKVKCVKKKRKKKRR